MEYASNGCLQQFLRDNRTDTDDQHHVISASLTSRDLITFAYQVACGMEYISVNSVSVVIVCTRSSVAYSVHLNTKYLYLLVWYFCLSCNLNNNFSLRRLFGSNTYICNWIQYYKYVSLIVCEWSETCLKNMKKSAPSHLFVSPTYVLYIIFNTPTMTRIACCMWIFPQSTHTSACVK